MGDLRRDAARAADDECVPLLDSSQRHEHYDGESPSIEFPSAMGEPSDRPETRPSSVSNELTANDLPISPQAERGHGMSSALGSRSEIRPALTSTEAESKSWIKTVLRKLLPNIIARVKSSRDVSEPTHGDGHEEGKIWRQYDNKSFPMTIFADFGSQYNIIDPTTAHLIAPGGFDKVPEGSGGRMIDGSFLGFQGSVRAPWHVGNTRFPQKVIYTVFMVAERAIEYNLIIGRDEMRRHKIDHEKRRGGIFSFISRPNAIDPTTSASFTQDFNHDEAQEQALAARERWEIRRDDYAKRQATRLLSDYEQRYKDFMKTTPSFDVLNTEYRRLFSEAQATFAAQFQAPPPS